ncbi:hypothetical protein ACUXV3_10990 [Roseobacteraceae bacterium NS-SX3]
MKLTDMIIAALVFAGAQHYLTTLRPTPFDICIEKTVDAMTVGQRTKNNIALVHQRCMGSS